MCCADDKKERLNQGKNTKQKGLEKPNKEKNRDKQEKKRVELLLIMPS